MNKELAQLIVDCREELDDEIAPHLWSDEYLTKRLNDAVQEAALRARLLVESDRNDICRIAVTAGRAEYTLHPSVVVVRRASLASDRSNPLIRTTTAALDGWDRCSNTWRTDTGTPEYIVRDAQSRKITLVPIPTEDTFLHLTVWRNPAEDEVMEDDTDEPAIDAMYHDKLFHWAVFRALTRRDTEQNSTKDADRHLTEFETVFGPRPTAAQLQVLSTDPVTSTAPHYF